jgi:segregation and condensation protein B
MDTGYIKLQISPEEASRIRKMVMAVLFVTGDPVSAANLAVLADMDFEAFDELLTEMIETTNERNDGILIRRVADKVQLCSNAEYAPYIQKLLAPEIKGRFSNSVLETLSIIAYKQPVTRSEIDSIRGVRSDYAISVLVERGMIVEVGRKDVVGRPILFGTTDDFLRHFGISNLKELPAIDFEKYADLEEAE